MQRAKAAEPREALSSPCQPLCWLPSQQHCFRSSHRYSRSAPRAPREGDIIEYEVQIRLKVQGTTQWVWVEMQDPLARSSR
jgi:hypothetical protein